MNSYRVEFVRSKKTITVGESDSVLRVAVESGVDIEYLCTEGNCGACKAKLLEGEISYRRQPDIVWEEEKKEGIVLLCQAMPRSDLAIDA